MKRIKKRCCVLLAVALIFSLVLAGCPGRQERSPGGDPQEEDNKPPNELREIESSLEQLIGRLEEKREFQEDPEKMEEQQQQQGQQEGQGGNQQEDEGEGEEEGNGEQQQEEGQGGNGEGQQQEEQEPSPLEDWSEEEELLTTLHEQWNSFEPEAVKAGIRQDAIQGFEESLEELTMTINDNKVQESLLAANAVYRYVPDFFVPYEHETPPEVSRMKYYINEVRFNAQADRWDEAQKGIEGLEETWPRLRGEIRNDEENLAEEMDYAINDLGDAVEKQDQELVKIKGEIALDNLEEITEHLQEQQKDENDENDEEDEEE